MHPTNSSKLALRVKNSLWYCTAYTKTNIVTASFVHNVAVAGGRTAIPRMIIPRAAAQRSVSICTIFLYVLGLFARKRQQK
jgi:hypothetical protein